MRLRRRHALELPVLPRGYARELALIDARTNGALPAQARTRALLVSGFEAWVGLMAATRYHREARYQLVNADGTLLDVGVTIRISPTYEGPTRP